MGKRPTAHEDDFHYRLLRTPGHLLRRGQQRAVDIYLKEVGPKGPRPRQFAVLTIVLQNPGLNQTELVEMTGIDRSTIGDIVTRLVGRGWLERERTARDARTNALHVSAEGRRLVESVRPAVDRAQGKIMDPIPPHERDDALRILRLLAGLPAQMDSST